MALCIFNSACTLNRVNERQNDRKGYEIITLHENPNGFSKMPKGCFSMATFSTMSEIISLQKAKY